MTKETFEEVKKAESKDSAVSDRKTNSNYWKIDRILNESADYNLVIGERGNGKTYAIQEYCLKQYLESKKQCMILRRWESDIKQSNAVNFWDGNLINKLSEMTNGEFTTITLKANRYFLTSFDEKGKAIIDESNILGYVWDIAESERMKGQSYPNVDNIIFEEFISQATTGYMQDEITYFLSIVSTVCRDRTTVKIWLLGNTINPYNPYFELFGIKGLDLKQGDIWTNTSSRTGRKTAVEWCSKRDKGKIYGSSEKYFDFDKSKSSNMITDGKWQMPQYPLMNYSKDCIGCKKLLQIGIVFDDHNFIMTLFRKTVNKNLVACFCHVREVNGLNHLKPFEPVLDLKQNILPNYYTSFQNLPITEETQILIECLNNQKVWYQTNEVGSYFNNFYAQSVNNRS